MRYLFLKEYSKCITKCFFCKSTTNCTTFAPRFKKMKQNSISEKTTLHPRNIHRFGYDFDALITSNPDLKQYVFINEFETKTIDFSNPEAVKLLNKSILIHDYDIQNWDLPKDYL